MARARKKSVIQIAVSPNEGAAMLGIRAEYVSQAISKGALAVYQYGTKKRVLIVDLIAWVRTWNVRLERIRARKQRDASEVGTLVAAIMDPKSTKRARDAASQKLSRLQAAWKE